MSMSTVHGTYGVSLVIEEKSCTPKLGMDRWMHKHANIYELDMSTNALFDTEILIQLTTSPYIVLIHSLMMDSTIRSTTLT